MNYVASLFLILLCWMNQAQAVNLYQETVFKPLVADHKATLPGDLLTVLVLENSQAHTAADLSSGKNIKTALEAGYNHHRESVSLGLSGHGRSSAKTARNGKIKASLTVRIIEVFPNQTYRVEGLQRIRINGEEQTILLSGIVRNEDISPQNTILSTRLGDAQITYTGNGDVSNAQDTNYLYKMLSFVGLV